MKTSPLLRALFLLVLFSASAMATVPTVSVIPRPQSVTLHEGTFSITPETRLVSFQGNSGLTSTMTQLAARLRTATGFPLQITDANPLPARNYIFLNYIRDEELGKEGYAMEVTPDHIEINADGDAGFFYGMQTLFQLLPAAVFSPSPVSGVKWELPCLSIRDVPRFPWRGMHLDVSRHFFPKEFIYTYIDMLAMHKMNVFHWHLTDDQGWRVEIKKYPRLTQVAAWRADREKEPWDGRSSQADGESATYGGYYTQEDVKAIVQYAADRNIMIVPEIEMPAHTVAALAAYPEYSCTGGPFKVATGGIWPDCDIFCAGKEETFNFLEDILTEVMALFPSPYIHVGGDEADKTNWKKCPLCQSRIKKEGLKDEEELQSYFMKRIERFLNDHHRKMIGWDEILEGGLPSRATVMSWRGEEGGIAAARNGNDVVMTPGSWTYLSAFQANVEGPEAAIARALPLHKVYSYEPVPDSLTTDQAKHILGAQGCVWGEYIPTPSVAQFVTLPRMAALAEVFWSPKDARNWNDFCPRVDRQIQRYLALGYNLERSTSYVQIDVTPDPQARCERVTLSTEVGNLDIRYTVDGSTPTASSKQYDGAFAVQSSTTLSAQAFRGSEPLGAPSSLSLLLHKAAFKKVVLHSAYHPKYPGRGNDCLVDGLRGMRSFLDPSWQGYLGDDLDAVVDLGKADEIHGIKSGFLEHTSVYIFFPTSVEYSVSMDGKTFKSVGTVECPVVAGRQDIALKEFPVQNLKAKARYVRVHATNVGKVPAGYPGVGEPAWVFTDELVVE